MRMWLSIDGLDRLSARATGMLERAKNMQPALLRAGLEGLRAAVLRIKSRGGGSWPPTAEQGKGGPLFRTGRLVNSLEIGGSGNVERLESTSIVVGTNLNDNGFSYPRAVQEGTGIYGPSGAPITPKRGKFLVFEVNGQLIFARSVRGSPPRKFLFIDEELATNVRAIFAEYVTRGYDAGQP
jgi:hypothetical protein